jgi:hypothetical protein
MNTKLYRVNIFEMSDGERENVFSEIIETNNVASVEFSLVMLTKGTCLEWELKPLEATITLESLTSRIQGLLG